MKGKKRKMLEPEFKQIRALLDAGVEKTKIAEVTGRSYSLIKYVQPCVTYADYQQFQRDFAIKYAKKPTVTESIRSIQKEQLGRSFVGNNEETLKVLYKIFDTLVRLESVLSKKKIIF